MVRMIFADDFCGGLEWILWGVGWEGMGQGRLGSDPLCCLATSLFQPHTQTYVHRHTDENKNETDCGKNTSELVFGHEWVGRIKQQKREKKKEYTRVVEGGCDI